MRTYFPSDFRHNEYSTSVQKAYFSYWVGQWVCNPFLGNYIIELLSEGGRAYAFSGCFQILESPKIWPLLLSILGFPCGSAGKEFACNAGDLGLIPGLGRSCGEGKGYPLQYSGLENSMDSLVHGVAKSRARLRDFYFLSNTFLHH